MNRQIGVEDSNYVVDFVPLHSGHVTQSMRSAYRSFVNRLNTIVVDITRENNDGHSKVSTQLRMGKHSRAKKTMFSKMGGIGQSYSRFLEFSFKYIWNYESFFLFRVHSQNFKGHVTYATPFWKNANVPHLVHDFVWAHT